jgi:hypothetical protein
MNIAARLDDIGRPVWIGLMVLGFIAYWPVGLAILAFLIWSGRMRCWKRFDMEQMRRVRGRWHGPWQGPGAGPRWRRSDSSGNSAFDEYRAETLRRLEEEEREFHEFLDRLRQAKDKAEFDQFMASRRGAHGGPVPEGPRPESQD